MTTSETPQSTEPIVRHAPERSQYELILDGEVASFAAYTRHGETVVFDHTVTQPRHRGNGLAAVVVRHALDDTRQQGLHVVAQCWYVAGFIDAHPEYADLLVDH